jgi:hypothetical protein
MLDYQLSIKLSQVDWEAVVVGTIDKTKKAIMMCAKYCIFGPFNLH